MSAPQHPTEPVAPTSEATSGAVLSPPADADVPLTDEERRLRMQPVSGYIHESDLRPLSN